jgi:hypothetical protein
LLKSWRIIAANSSAVFFSLVIASSVLGQRVRGHFPFAFSPRRAGRKPTPCREIICERNLPIS